MEENVEAVVEQHWQGIRAGDVQQFQSQLEAPVRSSSRYHLLESNEENDTFEDTLDASNEEWSSDLLERERPQPELPE